MSVSAVHAAPIRATNVFRLPPVLACGLLTTCMDLAVAVGYWTTRGVTGERVLQSIAYWVAGPAAYAGGAGMAVAGAVLYLGMMCGLVAIYRMLVRRLPALGRRPLVHGALYGAAMYLMVFGALVPALTGQPAFGPPIWIAICLLAWSLLIGIPCALFARDPRT